MVGGLLIALTLLLGFFSFSLSALAIGALRKGEGTYKVDKIVLGTIEPAVNEGTRNATTFGSSTKRAIRTKNDLRSGDKDCTRNNESDGVGQGGGDQSSNAVQ